MRKRPPPSRLARHSARAALLLALGLVATVGWWRSTRSLREHPASKALSPPPPTFARDIGPVVFQHCSPCHRPGQSAPFNLLTYDDVRKRARQIAEVTRDRIMPPWKVEKGCGDFVGERTLSGREIGLFEQWMTAGMPEGNASEGAARPQWSDHWQLGEPDVIVTLKEPYTLSAEGADEYRTFILPIPTEARHYVRAVELRPGNAKAIHHAFMYIDPTRQSRRLDEKDAAPGFPGLHTPASAQMPEGQFLSWQPGKIPIPCGDGLAWTLEPGSDLLLQAHLRPSGKPEVFQPSAGFYFTDCAPTNTPLKIGLRHLDIDIPPGAPAWNIGETHPISADVHVLSLLPHAHYLARSVRATATLPDGSVRCLLSITNWDFNWQGEYVCPEPIFLPRGSTLSVSWTYDNSAANPHNPHRPPQRVRYGLQSTDEMAELWLQLLPVQQADRAQLARDYQPRVFREVLSYNRYLLQQNTNDARAHMEMGKVHLAQGDAALAGDHLRTAIRLDGDLDEAHYFLGVLFRIQNDLENARAAFESAFRLNPAHAKASGNLGLVLLQQGKPSEAETWFRRTLQLNPNDEIARTTLNELLRARETP